MKIWLLTAEHFHIPGQVCRAFATRELAEAEAVDLVDTMWRDSGSETTADNWEWRLATLQDEHGSDSCYVDLVELPVEGAP